jgi:hypothetical protein
MLPMLLAMGKGFPIIGDVISSLEGNRAQPPQSRKRPVSQPQRRSQGSDEDEDSYHEGKTKDLNRGFQRKPFPEF